MKYVRTKDDKTFKIFNIDGKKRYIRTKAGEIFDINDLTSVNFEELTKFVKEAIFLNEIIIKQADTIEELCDEFIVVDKITKHHSTLNVNDLGKLKALLDDYQIYGAIWTEKGLIYVAKMNDKGELELL